MTTQLPSHSPRYARLAGELLGAIRAGRYHMGSLLPTETALCQAYGVSRITVRAAMRELEIRGIVSRRPGVGTRVESNSGRERFVHASDSVEDFLQSLAKLTFCLLTSRAVTADADLADEFGCPEGQDLQRIEALRIDAGGLPVCYSVHHVPVAYAAAAEKIHGHTGSLATRIARAAGDEVEETRQVIDAQNLGRHEARLLHAKPRDAALLTRRWYLSSGGRVLVYARSLYPEGRCSYSITMRREQGSM